MYNICGELLVSGGIFLFLFWCKSPLLVVVHDAFRTWRQRLAFERALNRTKAGEGGKGDGLPPPRDRSPIPARLHEWLCIFEKRRGLAIRGDRCNARSV